MKILFDYHAFDLQKFGGISRMFTKLLEGLELQNIDFDLPLKYSKNYYLNHSFLSDKKFFLENVPGSVVERIINKYPFRGKSTINKIFSKYNFIINPILENQNLAIKALKEGNFDIFHPTYYETYYLPYLKDKKLVVTVYDMIHELFPEFFMGNAGWWTMVNKYKSLMRADHIITISESTKKDLINVLGIDAKKITPILINSEIDDDGSISTISEEDSKRKYFLFVGNRAAYKNFYFLIPALSKILQNENCFLYCLGGGNFNSDDIEMFKTYGVDKYIKYFDGHNANLKTAYENSLGLIYPSSYEGFGMPLLEAARHSCLNIMSDIPTSREVIGDAGVYFDAKDIVSLQGIIVNRINGKYTEEISRAKEVAKKFSWDKMVTETIEVYKLLSK